MQGKDDMQPERTSAAKLTYDDFLSFPEDGRRHELIDGEHYVTPSPSIRHQRISQRLTVALGRFLEDHRLGEVFCAPLDVILSDVDVIEPDLLYVAAGAPVDLSGTHVRGAPTLVIEILSPGTRKTDEQTKRRLYNRVGVREYWVVDPELDVVKIYRRADGGGFPRVAELSREAGDDLVTLLLPGFELPLDTLFR
jgi:Uma2 family endonuclease